MITLNEFRIHQYHTPLSPAASCSRLKRKLAVFYVYLRTLTYDVLKLTMFLVKGMVGPTS